MTRIEFLRSRIEMWMLAEEKAALGKSYTIDGVSYTRQDLSEIRKMLSMYQNELNKLVSPNKTGGLRRVILLDD